MRLPAVAGACLLFVLAIGCGKSGGQPSGAGGAGGSPGAGGNAAGTSGTGGSAAGTSGTGGSAAGTSGTGGSAAGTAGSAGNGMGAAGASGSAGSDAAPDASVDAVPDGPIDVADPEVGCTGSVQTTALVAPHVLILLDSSGSMNEDINNSQCIDGGFGGGASCGATSKWALVTRALKETVAATDGSINWGLKYFPDNQTSVCTVQPGAIVPIANRNASAVIAAIDAETTTEGGLLHGFNGTPTRAGESAAAAYLGTLVDAAPKFILLATDGLPNCAAGTGGSMTDDSVGAVQAVTDAHTMGISTFVVGVGTAGGSADATLSAMANAGGVARAAAPSYYPASSANELVAALRDVVTRSSSCDFTVGAPPAGVGRAEMMVEGDGTLIPRDTAHLDGWDFTGSSEAAIRIFGPRCAAVTAGTLKTIAARFPCHAG